MKVSALARQRQSCPRWNRRGKSLNGRERNRSVFSSCKTSGCSLRCPTRTRNAGSRDGMSCTPAENCFCCDSPTAGEAWPQKKSMVFIDSIKSATPYRSRGDARSAAKIVDGWRCAADGSIEVWGSVQIMAIPAGMAWRATEHCNCINPSRMCGDGGGDTEAPGIYFTSGRAPIVPEARTLSGCGRWGAIAGESSSGEISPITSPASGCPRPVGSPRHSTSHFQ